MQYWSLNMNLQSDRSTGQGTVVCMFRNACFYLDCHIAAFSFKPVRFVIKGFVVTAAVNDARPRAYLLGALPFPPSARTGRWDRGRADGPLKGLRLGYVRCSHDTRSKKHGKSRGSSYQVLHPFGIFAP